MNLSTFLHALGEVTETADGWLAICPAHSDHDPSLRVAVGKDGDRVLVRCRTGCETPVVMEALGMTMADLTSMTVDGDVPVNRRAISTDERPDTAAIAALRVELDGYVKAATQEARDYVKRRFGINSEDFDRLGFGSTPDKRVVFPFYDEEGVALGYQGRAIDPSVELRWKGPRRPEGGGSWAKHGFFEGAAGWNEVLVTEGPGDAATAVALGYDTAFIAGASNGSNERILDSIAEFAGGRKIIVCGDGDRAGQDFNAVVTRGLMARDCSVAVLAVPSDSDLTKWKENDPSGREIVRAIIEAAPLSSFSAARRTRDTDAYPLTDLGNARYLRDYAAAQGAALRFSPEAGFFVLNDGVWRVDELDTARAFAQEAAEATAVIARELLSAAESRAVQDPDEVRIARAWNSHAKYSQSSKGIDAALREVKALRDVATSLDSFDKRHDLLAVRNGVVNLRTGELLPSDPAYLITKRIDVGYNPEAKAPRWEKFLREIFPGHKDLPAYIQRLVGYGITGSTNEQCFAVLWGTGANGKSVLTDTLTEIFREITVTTPFSTFEDRPSGGIPNDIAALKGARLVMASEGEANKRMAEAVLKRVTGRDLISARFMRKEFFEFRPTFLLMLATNNKPEFRGQDEGLWRRVKLIPFERYFTPAERDHQLSNKLLTEAEGIVKWAVDGAVEWFAKGLMDPDAVVESTKSYRETSNALDGFLPGEWVLDDDAEGVTSSDLYLSYREWCEHEGIRDPWTKRTFNSALEERGMVKRRSNKGVVFDGIRKAKASDLVPDEPAEAPAPASKSTNPITGASLDAL